MSAPVLIATCDYYYGPRGRMDAEQSIVRRGEEFAVQPTFQAAAAECAEWMVARRIACWPKDWPKVSAATQASWDWAQAEVARLNAARPQKGAR